MNAPALTETQIHIAVADLLTAFAVPNLIWYHVPNGEHRHISVAVKLKKMGVKAGVADFALVLPSGLGAAFLELKKPGTGGRASRAQKDFRAECEAARVPYYIARDFYEARAWLIAMGAIKFPQTRSGGVGGQKGGQGLATTDRPSTTPEAAKC